MDRGELKRRSHPAGLVANGCIRNSLEDVRHGINWAAETSPEVLTEALKRGISGAFQAENEEIVMYLVTEANVPMEEINPYQLSIIQSLSLWEAVVQRGWDINQRTKSHGGLCLRLRLIDFVCYKGDLVEWLLDHGATVDDGEKDTVKCPPLLQSEAARGLVSIYKRLQELGAPHGKRELHLAVERASGPRPYMEMVRFLVDEIGRDVNELDGDEYFNDRDSAISVGPPLWWAVQKSEGGEEVVRFLLERGADPYLVGANPDLPGHDLFTIAERQGNEGALAVLQEWKDGKIVVQKKDS